ncbi:MAG: TipAS antibiotic-recognition domain-containing protein [Clostridia bacterium]|nr:TipAS antibiotic-recognition domain-containing protein [Clostridia bacterium]
MDHSERNTKLRVLSGRRRNTCEDLRGIQMKNYETEVRERYGQTAAYREHEQKTKNYTKEKWAEANDGMMAIFAEFAACKDIGASADSAEAQALVAKLQAHITANYYTCTDEILAGLGKMYVADERFKKNIDKYGEGTAEFAADAIEVYCRK